jgi:hypothetical protein
MFKIILGALLAAIAVFAWEALSWTVLGWHENGFRSFRDEEAVAEVIKANVTSGHGIYLLPAMEEAPKVATVEEKKAFEEKQTKGEGRRALRLCDHPPRQRGDQHGIEHDPEFFRSLICALLVAALLSQVPRCFIRRASRSWRRRACLPG